MKLPKMQPTFTLDAPFGAKEFAGRCRDAIFAAGLQDHAEAAGTCIEFKIEPSEARFWSPHLSVQITELDSGSQLFGRFSPRPEIWTMFMAIYAVVSIAVFGSLIFGYVQWHMGATPWSLSLVPIGLLLIGGLHVASLVGQSLSSDQMGLLRERLEQVIRIALDEGPVH